MIHAKIISSWDTFHEELSNIKQALLNHKFSDHVINKQIKLSLKHLEKCHK